MSTIQGYFDETILNTARIKAEALSFDDRIKLQFQPQLATYAALKDAQGMAQVGQPVTRGKDTTVDIEWINTCDVVDGANTSCTISGAEASTNIEQYTLTTDRAVSFSLYEDDFKDNDFDLSDALAKLFVRADKELTEWFCQRCATVLNLNLGTNVYTGGKGSGLVTATTTTLLPSYWNAELFAYLNRVAVRNEFSDPILLDQGNLYEHAKIAEWNAGNANGKGDFAMFGSIPTYFDLFNLDVINTTSTYTYMISKGSVAMASNYYNPDTLDKRMSLWRWSMPSNFMPGMTYDVFYEDSCDTNGNDNLKQNFKVKLTADLFANPTGCSATNTGILAFLCGTS